MDKTQIIGIDVGTGTIKVFTGTVATDGGILITGSGIMPASGFVKGVAIDVLSLAMSIKQAVDCAVMANAIIGGYVYLGISGMEIISLQHVGSIAPISQEGITQEDIQRVCRAAVLAIVSKEQQVLHALPTCFWVDKQKQSGLPIGYKGTCLEAETHIVTVPKIIIDELVAAVQDVGIEITGIVANAIVGAQVVVPTGAQQCLFMDIGAGTTELVLYRDGQIWLSASLPLGGDYITRDIMQGVGISQTHAEEVKRYYAKLDRNLRGQDVVLDCNDYGTTDKQVPYDFLYNIVESRVDEIVYLVHDYLKPSLTEVSIDQIFVTGGCSALPSIIENIEKTFGVIVHTAMPEQLSPEYAYSSNTACYGIMCHAAKHLPHAETLEHSTWNLVLNKIKRFFQ